MSDFFLHKWNDKIGVGYIENLYGNGETPEWPMRIVTVFMLLVDLRGSRYRHSARQSSLRLHCQAEEFRRLRQDLRFPGGKFVFQMALVFDDATILQFCRLYQILYFT